VLGRTGRNFAAGMSGGVAFVLDLDGEFKRRCNLGMVDLEPLAEAADIALVRDLIERHVGATGSVYARRILQSWIDLQPRFVKVMPRDYKRVLAAEARARAEGREPTFTELVGQTSG
jgi:glutamate synthase (NADPH/NADH) large chain